MTTARGRAFAIRLEVAARRQAGHGLDSSSSQPDTLYSGEYLFRVVGRHLDEADRRENLNRTDHGSRHARFVRDAADEVSRRNARVVSHIELQPDTGLVDSRWRTTTTRTARVFARPPGVRSIFKLTPPVARSARRPIVERTFSRRRTTLLARVVFHNAFR